MLLLGSASIHTLSLQKRLRIHSSSDESKVADQLRSAAQAFVVAAVGLKPVCCGGHRWNGLVLLKIAQVPIHPG